MKQPASAYLQRFYYDIIVLDPKIMRMLIDLVGVERIVMGTDFPQLMSVRKPIEFVDTIPGLTSRAVPITPETIGGNHVVLDLGGGHFAFYAHMQPGRPASRRRRG